MGGRRSSAALSVIVAVVGLLVVGVAASADARQQLGRSRATSAAGVRGWRRGDLRAVSQPVAVGNRFLLYGARGGGLQVVALNASSGSTAWTAAASPSGI